MKERFHTLDAMRGIAALAVVLYHAGRLVPRGYLAVDLFFALSGFVLYHAYAADMRPGRFLVERAIRLGPMMVVGAAVGLAINGGSPWTLLMVPTGDRLLYPANIPLWSLLCEYLAGATFALLLAFGRPAWIAATGVGLLGLAAGIIVRGSADLGFFWGSFGFGLARTAFSFCIGIAIYRLVARSTLRLGGAWFLVPLALPFTAMMATGFAVTVDILAVLVVMPLSLWLGAICRFPSVRVASWLGVPSFALYAVHHPLVKSDWPPALTIPAAVLIALLLGFRYEPPLRRALLRGWQRRFPARQRVPVSAAVR